MSNKRFTILLSSLPRSRKCKNINGIGSPHSRGGRLSGFTLVEVLISAIILSVTVFGILRLSNNNASQIGVIEKNKEMYEVISNTRECLKSFDFDSLNSLTSTASVNFGPDNNVCMTGAYDAKLSFSGIILNSYDESGTTGRNEYYSYVKINTGTTAVSVENYVTDGRNTKKSTYKIYK